MCPLCWPQALATAAKQVIGLATYYTCLGLAVVYVSGAETSLTSRDCYDARGLPCLVDHPYLSPGSDVLATFQTDPNHPSSPPYIYWHASVYRPTASLANQVWLTLTEQGDPVHGRPAGQRMGHTSQRRTTDPVHARPAGQGMGHTAQRLTTDPVRPRPAGRPEGVTLSTTTRAPAKGLSQLDKEVRRRLRKEAAEGERRKRRKEKGENPDHSRGRRRPSPPG